MFYDPNYKNQVFWESNDISYSQVWAKLKDEIRNQAVREKAPGSRLSAFVKYGVLGMVILTLLSAVAALVITKSLLFTLVAGLCFMFFWLGWLCLFIGIVGFVILPKRYSVPVEAACIGYSISGIGGSNEGGGGIPVCPVFEYEFGGNRFTAYDGVYENINRKPGIGTKTEILIDPEQPEELRWNRSNKNAVFFFLAFGFAVALSSAIFLIVLNDDNFMNEALGRAASNPTPSDKAVNIIEERIDIEGLDEEFTIYFIADAHICLCDGRDESVREECESRYLDFMRDSRGSEENFTILMDYVREDNPDFIIFGGDITDEATYSSIEYVKSEISKLQCPYYYLMGNHDFMYGEEYFSEKAYKEYRPRFSEIGDTERDCVIIPADAFNLLLLSDCSNQVSDKVPDAAYYLSEEGKPVIVGLHVPMVPTYGDSDLIDKTNEVWGTSYMDYSRVLMGEHANTPDEATQSLIDFVSDENGPVKGVFAGHIHFYHRDYMSKNTPQVTAPPAFERGAIKIVLY